MKRHANPKPNKDGIANLKRVDAEAYPGWSIKFCSHGDLGGYRAPRDHTLAFRLVDDQNNYRSNVIWVKPQALKSWTAAHVKKAVDRSNGR